jgi:benzoyl-CoA 2,3-dioxygenase component A
MRARRADVARLLTDDDTFVYLCGHKRMEAGVMEAFSEAAASVGADWAALRERLRAEGRLHVETY